MIRRGGGRTPPFILVGLIVFVLILGFNYWTISSQNGDLQRDLEKLQAEVKISAVKQDQSEKKNMALQETVHEMENISGKLKKKLQEEEDHLKTKDQDNQKKAYEISSLKTQIVRLQEQVESLNQQVEEREVEIAKKKETNEHLVSQRDDAVDAIAEKDSQINTLRRQLEQAEEKLAAQKREELAASPPKLVPGPFNLPNVEQKEVYQGPGQLGYVNGRAVRTRDTGMRGIIFHRDTPILPQDPPGARRAKPRFSVADLAREPAGVVDGVKEVAPVNSADDLNHHPQIQPPGLGILPVARPPPILGLSRPRYNQGRPLPLAIPDQGPAVMERPAAPLAADPDHHPLQPPNKQQQEQQQQQQQPQQEVLVPPPQLPPHQDTSLVNVQSEGDKQGNPKQLNQKAASQERRLVMVNKQMQQEEEKEVGFSDGGDGDNNQKPLLNAHGETEDKNHAHEQIDEPEAWNPPLKPDDHNHAGEQVDDSPVILQNPLPALHQLQQPMQQLYQPQLPFPQQAPHV
ncbi:hypothetical protein Pcinc_015567 [Petrolisthes cinctipes]|uniref:Golgi membrane protein 2 n=1 Tax=Petrolisthes cinctipes TaxID=88211 RepID=A0AAE1KS19_PETCI|nr:hypothetical protein Pcinc_020098 [Petrolisthes cinctipes]KAK3879925.1 hypothetical protein Pcinc_015567 [Petrolisthes cinctipes]